MNADGDLEIGDLAYRAYSAGNPGKVVAIQVHHAPGDWNGTDILTLRFLNGKEQDFQRASLQSFDRLVAEHKRKAVKFARLAEKLRKL